MSQSYHYQEITCLPDHEISIGFVMGKVMDAVHLALVNASSDGKNCPIGISFPEYRVPDSSNATTTLPIGSKLRLFGRNADDLVRLGLANQIERLSDYVHWTSIRRLERRVIGYATYKRCQPKSSKERLIRRQMKRTGLSEAAVQTQYATFRPRYSKLPYVNMHSFSTGKCFRLYVDRLEATTTDEWSFSTYGLSPHTAVPQF